MNQDGMKLMQIQRANRAAIKKRKATQPWAPTSVRIFTMARTSRKTRVPA